MDALPTHRCVPDSRDHSRNVSKRRLFGEGGEDRQSEACEDGGEDERCSQCNDQILPIMAHRIVKAVHAGFAQTLSHHAVFSPDRGLCGTCCRLLVSAQRVCLPDLLRGIGVSLKEGEIITVTSRCSVLNARRHLRISRWVEMCVASSDGLIDSLNFSHVA